MRRREFLSQSGALGFLCTMGNAASAQVLAKTSVLAKISGRRIVVDGCSPTVPTSEYLALLRKGGVDCWHMSGKGNLATLSSWHRFLDENSSEVSLARRARDIRSIVASGKIAVTFGWQWSDPISDAGLNNWNVDPPQTCLRAYYELGLRMMGLTYNLTNEFAGGCLDPHIGLTKAGRRLVQDMQALGILIDCGGHLGERSSLDVISMAGKPVVCSHSNVRALNDNPRATSDRVIEGIAGTGGLFAVSAINAFMTWGAPQVAAGKTREEVKRADIGRFIDELDYLKRLVGVDHIGLGFDYTHGARGLIDPANSFVFPPEMVYKMSPIEYIEGLEDIGKLPRLEQEMKKRGWSDANISKIFGENWMRVYESVWGG